MKSAPKIVVTGANGFVGSCLVEALYLDRGFDIVPTSRRAHAGGRVARFGCQLQPVDLAEQAAVVQLVDGADAVVHCAFGAETDHLAATQHLLDASVAKGVKIFVHLSTTEVYAASAGTISEDAPLQLEGENYGAQKARIDKLVCSYSEKIPSLIVLRPGIIYGPLSDAWTILPIKRLTGGWSPSRQEMQGVGNLVHIGDLCDIIVQLLRRAPPGLRVFNVVGPDVLPWSDYFEGLAAALNLRRAGTGLSVESKAQLGLARSLLRLLPTNLRRTLVRLAGRMPAADRTIANWRRLHHVEPSTADKQLYARVVRYSTARLVQEGLAPRISLTAGVNQCAAWAREVGLA